MTNKEKLIQLYKEMAELTLPECKNNCRCPLSCCSPEYCELASTFAKEVWGVKLKPVDKDARLPFMSPTGCVVPPHLRPHCTLHTCAINSLGFKRGDPEWTTKYFQLREQIDILEYEHQTNP